MLEPISADYELSKPIIADMFDHSKGGLALRYKGKRLPIGLSMRIFIDTLHIVEKTAEVRWSKSKNGDFISGLQWV